MTEPRTISGQAAVATLRPHLKRALGQSIVRVENEAIAPFLGALREADEILVAVANLGPVSMDPGALGNAGSDDVSARPELIARARAIHLLVSRLIEGEKGR
ncbi:MAG: hypothetical protein HY264_04630 [Chloroflexi bacterium]|nr:hypothetical protein [Chloroflexota bacterium]